MTAKLLAELQERSFAGASAATASSLAAERRLTGAEIDEFLGDRRYATIATTRRDGRPHAAMTMFLWFEDELWLPAMVGAVRTRNIAANPFASVVVAEDEGPQHVMVLFEGEAAVATEPTGGLSSAWASRFGWTPAWADAWIRVRPTKVFSYAAEESRFAARERA